jgi:hypothetical protein
MFYIFYIVDLHFEWQGEAMRDGEQGSEEGMEVGLSKLNRNFGRVKVSIGVRRLLCPLTPHSRTSRELLSLLASGRFTSTNRH